MFPKQFLYTVIPFACVVLGDSLIYLILPLSPEEFGIKDYWGLKLAFWIGIALSINRFVRIFTNFLASKYYLKYLKCLYNENHYYYIFFPLNSFYNNNF